MNIPNKCERCGKESTSMIMSMFSDEWICMDCKKKEKMHPDYNRAASVEHHHVVNKDYNFQGIGKPVDL